MAISFVGINTSNTIPAGFQAGDLLLYAVQSNSTVTTPTDWTLVNSRQQTEWTYLFSKIAVGGDANPTSLGTHRATLVYRGVDQTTPIRSSGVNSNNFATTSDASITGAQADDWLMLVGGASAVRTATPPGDFTERSEAGSSFRSLWTADTNGVPGAGDYTRGPTWSSATTIRTILAVIAPAATVVTGDLTASQGEQQANLAGSAAVAGSLAGRQGEQQGALAGATAATGALAGLAGEQRASLSGTVGTSGALVGLQGGQRASLAGATAVAG